MESGFRVNRRVRFVQKRETDFLFSLAVSLGDKAVSLAVRASALRRYAIDTDRRSPASLRTFYVSAACLTSSTGVLGSLHRSIGRALQSVAPVRRKPVALVGPSAQRGAARPFRRTRHC